MRIEKAFMTTLSKILDLIPSPEAIRNRLNATELECRQCRVLLRVAEELKAAEEEPSDLGKKRGQG